MGDLGKIQIHYRKEDPIDITNINADYEYSMTDMDNDYHPFTIAKLQNYNPIYSVFFEMTEKNQQRLTLKHPRRILNLNTIYDFETESVIEKPVFVKFSPLLDPIKYMIGKYPIEDDLIRTMPQIGNATFPKLADVNNASYIDGFFSYLSSQLLHHHRFIHGVDYYGSYVGVQEKFKMNVSDDIEYLSTSSFFNNHVGKYFTISDDVRQEYMGGDGSRANKVRITLQSFTDDAGIDLGAETLDLDLVESIDQTLDQNLDSDIVYTKPGRANSSASSTDSSNNSEINYSSEEEDDNDESESEESEGSESEESGSEESESEESESDNIYAYIPNFPVQMICLEKCTGTLDKLFERGSIDEIEGASALFQIVMILITYQKAFAFTHNDLHTNNIMYVTTDLEYLHYMYDNKVYKVPTYGRIFKLIDFGRGIYKYNGKVFCSDSFGPGGDAATQYNCEPYMNSKKPRLDPNPSFDLCRLGCSIYDFLIEDEPESEMDDFQKTVLRWCSDDKGKNILYKRDGEERYPNFKLYKMIARTVNQHVPKDQLRYPFFSQFLMAEKQRKKFVFVDEEPGMVNIDAIPSYV